MTLWKHYHSFKCEIDAVSRSSFTNILDLWYKPTQLFTVSMGASNSVIIPYLKEGIWIVSPWISIWDLKKKKFPALWSLLQVTTCSDSSERSIELLDHFMCKVIFLCLLILKEEGLCLSNNGIYKDY